MAAKRWRNAVVLAAIESVEGTEQSISASTDGIVVENCQVNFGQSVQQTNEVTGSLDGSDDVPVAGALTLSFSTYVKGNGTPGTAPEIGKLLKACGWTETVTASAIPPAAQSITNTSGGDIVAPSTDFSGSDDAYNGMPLLLSGVPATSTFALIRDFVDSSQLMKITETFSPAISAATKIQIPINVMYKPHSSTVSSLTFHVFADGIKHAIIGCRGTFTLNLVSGKTMMFNWTFSGILASAIRTDTSPSTPTYPDIAAPKLVWRNDSANGGFTVDGTRIGVSQLTYDNGNKVSNEPNPNQPLGIDIAEITERAMTCKIDPKTATIATRDFLSKLENGTLVSIAAFARRSAGNSFGIVMPAAQPTSYAYGNREGKITDEVGFKCTGLNQGAYLAFW